MKNSGDGHDKTSTDPNSRLAQLKKEEAQIKQQIAIPTKKNRDELPKKTRVPVTSSCEILLRLAEKGQINAEWHRQVITDLAAHAKQVRSRSAGGYAL